MKNTPAHHTKSKILQWIYWTWGGGYYKFRPDLRPFLRTMSNVGLVALGILLLPIIIIMAFWINHDEDYSDRGNW